MSSALHALDDLEQLIFELVAIESVNPDLIPLGSGETKVSRFVALWLAAAGLEVEVVEPVPGRPSVVGTLRGSGGGRSLMLNAHMDTVGAGGMADAFSPVVRDGRVYGRGAYDMKASLAAIMIAAREANKLQLRGVVAHGSRADIGVDAIAHMGRVLTSVLELNEHLQAGPRHPLMGTGSIHASLIEGGQEMSTYPARCVAKLERRTVPGENGASSLREILELIGDERATGRVLLERPPSEVDADHPLTHAVAQAAGGDPLLIGVAYWMDMALLNAAGIPTVAYGPEGEGEHADVEWVDVASVEKCVQVYLRAAKLLCDRLNLRGCLVADVDHPSAHRARG